MINKLMRMQRSIRSAAIVGNRDFANRLLDNGYWPGNFRFRDGMLVLAEPEVVIEANDSLVLLHYPEIVEKLAKEPEVAFNKKDGQFTVTTKGIRVELTARHDIFIVDEILVRRAKEVTLPDKCVIWDIGANVGIAALYFAAKAKVEAVYSYEPFPSTAAQMRRNLELNPHLAPKIHLQEYAVGTEDGTTSVFYTENDRANMSLFIDHTNRADASRRRETIQIKNALTALNEIRSNHPGVPVVVKMDCEGSEKVIVPFLLRHDPLDDVPIFTMEFHDRTYMEIVSDLEFHGYTVFSQATTPFFTGDIFACRSLR